MNTGIYKIENKSNGMLYVGSAVNLKRRKKQHFEELRKNKHFNDYLQKTFNKHGESNLEFKIIIYCNKEDLIFFEQRAIDVYGINNLYNITPTAGSVLGIKHTEQAKRNMSLAKKNMSPELKKEWIDKISGENSYMYGKPYSEKRKKSQSEKLKGKKRKIEHIIKISNSQRGKKRPNVSREKNGSYKIIDDDVIISMAKNGKTTKEIINKTGATSRMIIERLKWNNIEYNAPNKKKKIDVNIINKHIENGLSYYQISKILNVSTSVIGRNYRKSIFYKKVK